ncbi:MAG: hypothetical protein ACXQT4_02005 [Methanotrichaceae archaeon]
MIEVLVISKVEGDQIPHLGTLECSKGGEDLVLLGETQTLTKVSDYVAANPQVAEATYVRDATFTDLKTAFKLNKTKFKSRGEMIGYLLKYDGPIEG